MRAAEFAHPFPIVVRRIDIVRLLFFQVCTGAESTIARAGQHHDRDAVVPGRILEGHLQFPQRGEVDTVQHTGPIDCDRGPTPVLLEQDVLEVERLWILPVNVRHEMISFFARLP